MGLISWFVNNYETANSVMLTLGMGFVFIIAVYSNLNKTGLKR